MKARRVKGLDADMPLADAAERIIGVRLTELCDLAARAQDPAAVRELHDTRIAAKRLRYVLEMTADCFGPYAKTATKRAKDVQDLLGEIHDCDVMLPRLDELRWRTRERDAAYLVGAAGRGSGPPNADAYRGLEPAFARTAAVSSARIRSTCLRTTGSISSQSWTSPSRSWTSLARLVAVSAYSPKHWAVISST